LGWIWRRIDRLSRPNCWRRLRSGRAHVVVQEPTQAFADDDLRAAVRAHGERVDAIGRSLTATRKPSARICRNSAVICSV